MYKRQIRDSVIARSVRAHSYALVESSVLFDNVEVGRNSHIRRAIIDKDVVIPPGTQIGQDLEQDRARGLTVTDNGVVVVPKGFTF